MKFNDCGRVEEEKFLTPYMYRGLAEKGPQVVPKLHSLSKYDWMRAGSAIAEPWFLKVDVAAM